MFGQYIFTTSQVGNGASHSQHSLVGPCREAVGLYGPLQQALCLGLRPGVLAQLLVGHVGVQLATLIAALILLALIRALTRLQYRRLTLLAKCLLVSLLVHMLLMLTFAFWSVSTTMASDSRRLNHLAMTVHAGR